MRSYCCYREKLVWLSSRHNCILLTQASRAIKLGMTDHSYSPWSLVVTAQHSVITKKRNRSFGVTARYKWNTECPEENFTNIKRLMKIYESLVTAVQITKGSLHFSCKTAFRNLNIRISVLLYAFTCDGFVYFFCRYIF
jgi:hypothetical protein